MNIFTGWRASLRHWSLWLITAAATLLGAALATPDIVLHYWGLVPDTLKTLVPQSWAPRVSFILMVLAALAKLMNQAEVKANVLRLVAWLRLMGRGTGGTVKTRHAVVASSIALVGAFAFGLISNLVQDHEGTVHKGYLDPVGIPTKCTGDRTNVVVGRVYTDAECKVSFDAALIAHISPVLACTPALRARPYQLAAAVDLAYNIGASAYCHSTAARQFNAGHYRAGCEAMSSWVYAHGRKLPGLVKRRADDVALCLRGAT